MAPNKLMHGPRLAGIEIDRKRLSDLSVRDNGAFAKKSVDKDALLCTMIRVQRMGLFEKIVASV